LMTREQDMLKKYIEDNLRNKRIRESKLLVGSLVMFVLKVDGIDKLYVDYRRLNAITIKDCYTLLLIQELRDKTRGAKYFTKLDQRDAYHLVRIKKGDEWKTAFRTQYGLYEYTVVPFGLTNAPAMLQRRQNQIFRELIDKFLVVYMDDFLIYSKTLEQHIKDVKQVLGLCRLHDLSIKLEKCEFHEQEVEFLGYVINGEGVSMSKVKVQAVLDWPTPTTKKEVQSFMGFANYYRKFIKGYGDISAHITKLTRNDIEFGWTKEADTAFKELKRRFSEEPVTKHHDPEKETIVETDASDYALGACMSQRGDDGKLHPVAYHSRQLTAAELNYDVHDKELLAIVDALKTWRVYLQGAKHTVQIYTDHKNLMTFTTTKVLNRRQVRWSEMLSLYDFRIMYRKGSENARADALSRQKEYEGYKTERPQKMLRELADGSLTANRESILVTVSIEEDPRIETNIKAAYKKDGTAERILNWEKANSGQIPEGFNVDERGLIRFKGLVYIPYTIRNWFVTDQHGLPGVGHPGVTKTMEVLSRDYYFPGMKKVVEKVVGECNECQKSKPSRHAPYGLLKPVPVPDRAWKSVSMDFIVKLPPSKEPATGTIYDSIWVIIERLTKYAHFLPFREDITAEDMSYLLIRHIVYNHGLAEEFIIDRDKLFKSKFWQTLMSKLKTNHKMSTAYHLQTNGLTKKTNRTLEQYLRTYVNQQQDD